MKVPQEVIDDFRNHLYFCFKHLGLGEPTKIQYELARQIQEGPDDQIIAAGRGTGKSTITACLASWIWLRNPNGTFLVLSNTQGKAIDFVSQARKILSVVPYCQHLVPRENDKDNALGFNIAVRTKFTQDLSCAARGITGQITGLHSDFIILDDIEIAGKNETPVGKETLIKKLAELESIRNKPSRVIFLGTPHYQDSIYNVLKESYPMIKYPAEVPDPTIPSEMEDVADWVLELALEPGEPTQPERFDKAELASRKAKMGPSAYALQYKLDTSLADLGRYPLKLRDLIILDIDPEVGPDKIVWQGQNPMPGMPVFGISGDMVPVPMHVSSVYLPFQQTVLFIDPSGRGADETGVCVASVLSGMIFVHELLGIEGGYDDGTLKKIARLVNEYKVNLVRVESNFGDGLFTKVLVPFLLQHCDQVGVEEYRVSGQKELRIIKTLEPVMAMHRLCVSRKAIRDQENQLQITRLHAGRGALKHDDRVDVLSAAVEYFKAHMSIDTERASEEYKKKEWEQRVKDWANNFRASDYVPCSGATKVVSTNHKPKQRNNQWGW
jgi:predicted phage terminase large subunit-like protein